MSLSFLRREANHVRAITQGDVRSIMRMVDTAWRVHIRVPPVELGTKIRVLPGFLAEDQAGLRGFMVMEPQRPHVALIIAAGLRDTWNVRPYLDLILPEVERSVRAEGLPALAHIGNVAWLVEDLQARGFEIREWIVAFERHGTEPPPATAAPARLRSAHSNDLSALLTLDGLAFNHIWRKSAGNLNEALASADSFTVAELNGQLVGYTWYERYSRHAHLTRLAVHPAFQGRGIGAQLLHTAIVNALESGVNMITLNPQETNDRSRSLYERFGFIFTRQRMPVLWKNLP
jgi:ribosomal protein S18 acetylase RimI-like enzyme